MLYQSINDTDGIPFDETVEWVCDTVLKLSADHPARIPGLISCVLLDSEQVATKVEMWVEAAPNRNQPAAYLFNADPETGEWVEDKTQRSWFSDDLSIDRPCILRMSNVPDTEFRVGLKADTYSGPPWAEEDGHGPVTEVNARHGLRFTNTKKTGERVLHVGYPHVWLYNWQAACKLARRDGWNTPPYDAPNRIERAVLADFKRLQGYLLDQWCYVGVVVETDYNEDSLWQIESDDKDGQAIHAVELANNIATITLDFHIQVQRKANREASERLYWEERDVPTVIDTASSPSFPYL